MHEDIAANRRRNTTVPFKDLVIFEMANNHQGSIEHGKAIVSEMANIRDTHGINAAVKLQYRDLDTFIHPEALKNPASNKHIDRFLKTRLSDVQMRQLVGAIQDAGMEVVITPFDERSVDRAVEHGVTILKVASCSSDDFPLLEKIAATGKPVICSVGGKTFDEIDTVYNFFTHKGVAFGLMHCVSLYPTPMENLHLGIIERMRKRYPGVPIGYSGHECPDNLEVPLMALSKGAEMMERHVGLPTSETALNAYSMNPKEAEAWVRAIIRARKATWSADEKSITKAEKTSLTELARGVFAKQLIRKGQPFSPDRVYYAFPCREGQLTSGQHREAMVASKDYQKDEPIYETRPVSRVELKRKYIHRFKAMFAESGIVTGPKSLIELSHHYGVENFSKTGALLITIVNGNYCKKLIAQLPGQAHPVHAHIKKLETFQVLWGELDVVVNDVKFHLKEGDVIDVQPGDRHEFSTKTGVIAEEISTASFRDDSKYIDPGIAKLDPLERKTFIEEW